MDSAKSLNIAPIFQFKLPNWIGYSSVAILAFIASGFTEFFIVNIIIGGGSAYLVSSPIEEISKFAGAKVFNLNIKKYYFTVATFFTVAEMFLMFHELSTIDFMVRLLPHYLFAIVFMVVLKKNQYVALLLAIIVHLLWNYVCIYLIT